MVKLWYKDIKWSLDNIHCLNQTGADKWYDHGKIFPM